MTCDLEVTWVKVKGHMDQGQISQGGAFLTYRLRYNPWFSSTHHIKFTDFGVHNISLYHVLSILLSSLVIKPKSVFMSYSRSGQIRVCLRVKCLLFVGFTCSLTRFWVTTSIDFYKITQKGSFRLKCFKSQLSVTLSLGISEYPKSFQNPLMRLYCGVPGPLRLNPAGTLRYIYVVFMFGGYVEITFDFMLECLVFLT